MMIHASPWFIRAMLPWVCLLLLLSFSAFPTLAHEGHNEAFGGGETTVTTAQKILVTPEGQSAIGIKTQTVKPGALAKTLQATGTVQPSENRAYDVNPQVSGIVQAVSVKQGDFVRKGQSLAIIHSMEVANVLTQLLQDRAKIQADIARTRTQAKRDIAVQANQVTLTQVNFQREQILLKEGITARKDYIEAKTAYETAQVEFTAIKKQSTENVTLLKKQMSLTIEAVKNQLSVMGLPQSAIDRALASNQIVSEIPIFSPTSGIVTFRDITLGENLAPAKKIFSIVNLSPIWVIVNVFQEQLPLVHLGQTVRIKTPSNDVLYGTISSIGTTVDPSSRTIPVRIVTDNVSGELKPGMFVTAEVVIGQTAGGRIVIPSSAVIDDNGHSIVYVQYGNYFQPVPIRLGQRTSNEAEIIDGLFEGDKIVFQGAKQLQAQSLLTAKAGTPAASKDKQAEQNGGVSSNNSLPTLLIGILIGLGVAGAVGFGWFFFKNRSRLKKGAE